MSILFLFVCFPGRRKTPVPSIEKDNHTPEQEGLVSNYTTTQFKPHKDTCNESKTEHVLKRQFQEKAYRNVVISDLTYVRVGTQWNYICVLVDLFNREIIGYSAGEHKTAELVKEVFQRVEGNSCRSEGAKIEVMGLCELV